MSSSKITDVVESLLKGVQGISKSETIVGAAQQAGDATVIPIHRLKIAFGAASANAGARGAKVGGDSGGYGAGGAVELEPVAAIAVAKDGTAHLLTVEGDEKAGWTALLQEVPDIVSRLANAVGDRVRLELSSRGLQTSELSEGAAEQPSAELPGKKV
ncbi:MAG TPA: spore germination protein GerW family protein [Polyangiaceae bacterium]